MSTITTQVYSNYTPVVKSGETLKINVNQNLGGLLGPALIDTAKPEDVFVTIEGPQVSLTPADIVGVYPAPGSDDSPDEFLPHIAFTRRTLPWERFGPDSKQVERKAPWLALLLLKESEMTKLQGAFSPTTVKDVKDTVFRQKLGDLGLPRSHPAPSHLHSKQDPQGDPAEDPAENRRGGRASLSHEAQDRRRCGHGRLDCDLQPPARLQRIRVAHRAARVAGETRRDLRAELLPAECKQVHGTHRAAPLELYREPRRRLRAGNARHQLSTQRRRAALWQSSETAASGRGRAAWRGLRCADRGEWLLARGNRAHAALPGDFPINRQGKIEIRGPLRPFAVARNSKGFAVRPAPQEFLGPAPGSSLDYSHAAAFTIGRLLALADSTVLEALRDTSAGKIIDPPIAINTLPVALQKRDWVVNPVELGDPWTSQIKEESEFAALPGDFTGIAEQARAWKETVLQELRRMSAAVEQPVGSIDILAFNGDILATHFQEVVNVAISSP